MNFFNTSFKYGRSSTWILLGTLIIQFPEEPNMSSNLRDTKHWVQLFIFLQVLKLSRRSFWYGLSLVNKTMKPFSSQHFCPPTVIKSNYTHVPVPTFEYRGQERDVTNNNYPMACVWKCDSNIKKPSKFKLQAKFQYMKHGQKFIEQNM